MALTVGQVWTAQWYQQYSTNFTNNGGPDNSTCDISIAGLFFNDVIATVGTGFALIESDVGTFVSTMSSTTG